MAHANDDGAQSSEEDMANWARLLNHASSGASAAETNLARHAKAYEHSLLHSESYVVDDGKFWM